MTKLFLDDVRNAPDDTWHVVRNYAEFVEYVTANGVPDLISFDHDLGRGEAQKRPGGWLPRAEYKELKTGYDCAKWLIESGYNVKSWQVHSMNPVGADNIRKYLETAPEQREQNMSNTHLGHYYGPAPSDAELGIGNTRLNELIAAARTVVMTPEDREAQRRSFAFGNISLSNPAVTRDLVDRVADEMQRDK